MYSPYRNLGSLQCSKGDCYQEIFGTTMLLACMMGLWKCHWWLYGIYPSEDIMFAMARSNQMIFNSGQVEFIIHTPFSGTPSGSLN